MERGGAGSPALYLLPSLVTELVQLCPFFAGQAIPSSLQPPAEVRESCQHHVLFTCVTPGWDLKAVVGGDGHMSIWGEGGTYSADEGQGIKY